jgi:hypothetical protein
MVAASIQFFARSEHGTDASVLRSRISSQGVLIQSMDAGESDSVQSVKAVPPRRTREAQLNIAQVTCVV